MIQESKIKVPNHNEELEEIIKKRKRYQILVVIQIIIFICIITVIGVSYINVTENDINCKENKLITSEIEWARYNSPFINYQTINAGATVKRLIMLVNDHNSEYAEKYPNEPRYQIRINNKYDSTGVEMDQLKSEPSENTEPSNSFCDSFDMTDIKASKKYVVSLNYENGDKTSVICNIDIQEQNQ